MAIENIINDIKSMLTIVDMHAPCFDIDDKNALEAYVEELKMNAAQRTATTGAAAPEIAFYSLLERRPRLRNAYFAVMYSEVVSSCLSKLQALDEAARTRHLNADEAHERQSTEDALAQARQKLSGLMQPRTENGD